MFCKFRIQAVIFMLIFTASVSAVTLFEIKDELGSPVLVVSTDGLRILNGVDTLMVISSSEIRANIKEDETKALSRTFSVSTTSAKGSQGNIMNVTTAGLDIVNQNSASKALGDTLMTISSKAIKAHIADGSKFSVTTPAAKGTEINVLEVGTESTQMREGSAGDDYTDFSPENIFLGLNAGALNTAGTSNTFIGNNAGSSAISGTQNVMIGQSAGELWNGDLGVYGNIFIGKDAAKNLTDGARNVMIGYSAGAEPLSTTSSTGNIFLGGMAGRKVNGDYNVLIGEFAGENYQTGGSPAYNNVFIGKTAGQHATGHDNIYIGIGAGKGEFDNVNPGNGNIYLGSDTGWAKKDSDRLRIGSLIWGKLSLARMLVVDGEDTDNTNGRKFFVNGSAGGTTDWYNDSDERLKKNIKTIDGALDKVIKLRGVNYEWKDPEIHEGGVKMGFIAQESKDIIPEAVDYSVENDRYTMQYASITAVLVEAVKELQKEINSGSVAQDEKINTLIKENKELKNKVQELESLRVEIELIKSQLSGYTSR